MDLLAGYSSSDSSSSETAEAAPSITLPSAKDALSGSAVDLGLDTVVPAPFLSSSTAGASSIDYVAEAAVVASAEGSRKRRREEEAAEAATVSAAAAAAERAAARKAAQGISLGAASSSSTAGASAAAAAASSSVTAAASKLLTKVGDSERASNWARGKELSKVRKGISGPV